MGKDWKEGKEIVRGTVKVLVSTFKGRSLGSCREECGRRGGGGKAEISR